MVMNSKFHENFEPLDLWLVKHYPLTNSDQKLDFERLSKEIEVGFFFQFSDFDSLNLFNENEQEKKTSIKFQHFPLLFLKTSYFRCIQISKVDSVIKIYQNTPMYLCSNYLEREFHFKEIHHSYEEITGKNIRIALLDSGIHIQYLKNTASVIKQIIQCPDDNSELINFHGTNLASLIVGSGKIASNLIDGVAPDSKLIDTKVFLADGTSTLEQIIIGLEKLLDLPLELFPHIILFGCSSGYKGSQDDILSRYIEIFSSKGTITIAPTGNLGPDPGNIGSPGMSSDSICVGASDKNHQKLFFSGRGVNSLSNSTILPKPTFILPGKNMLTATATLSGTSASAAIMAGIISLTLQIYPNADSKEIIKLLQKDIHDLILPRNIQGYGLPQIERILKLDNKINPKPSSYLDLVKFALKISGIFTLFAVAFIFISGLII